MLLHFDTLSAMGGILFIFGLVAGSAINSFLWRYQTKTTYRGRSMCPICKHQIPWYDNIPLLSWFLLSGKCRYCKKSISIQYPVVEILTGVTYLAIGLFSAPGKILQPAFLQITNAKLQITNQILVLNSILLILLLLVSGLLVTITVYDIKNQEIPNGFNLTFIITALLYAVAISFESGNPLVSLLWSLIAASGAFLFFYTFVFFSKETWMGGGDAKFAFGMGLLLGPAGVFVAILLASWSGAIYGLGLMAAHKATGKTAVPFGPFLALGTFLSLLASSQLIAWYAKIFLKM